GRGDLADEVAGLVVIARLRDGAVLGLEALDRGRGGLEAQPHVARLGPARVADGLRSADAGVSGVGTDGHGGPPRVDLDSFRPSLRELFLPFTLFAGIFPAMTEPR